MTKWRFSLFDKVEKYTGEYTAFGDRVGMFLWRAVLLAAVVAAVAFAGIQTGQLRSAIFGGSQAQTRQAPAVINSPCAFPGGSNSGSVNCGNTYNGVPAPQLQYQRMETQHAGDSYITNIFFNLISPFSPSQLAFEVHAPDIKDNLQIIPSLRAGAAAIVMTGHTGILRRQSSNGQLKRLTGEKKMTPARVFPIAMAIIWGAGAIIQAEITRAGHAYEHGYIFVAIMGFASVVFIGMFFIAVKLGR